jgi:hypothetical protein
MTRIIVKAKVGADGVLHLDVPVGMAYANSEVKVTIESAAARSPIAMTEQEWHDFIDRTAGTWQGDFERPAQGEFEKWEEF